MQTNLNPNRYFIIFCFLHLLAWTLIPTLFRHNLPLDSLEAANWGQTFQWGYDKHPYLSAWLAGFFARISGYHDWGLYLASQTAIITAFWAVYQLGQRILNPMYALIAVFMLEGIQYYTHFAVDFNNNIVEIALWSLVALYFYDALKTQKLKPWLLTGIFIGLAFIDKYYSGLLLVTMFGFICYDRSARHSFNHAGMYVAGLVALIIVMPNLLWLIDHDFISLRYAAARTTDVPTLLSHIINPSLFLIDQIGNFLGAGLLFACLLFGVKQADQIADRTEITVFDWRYLIAIGFGPLVLTLLISAIKGMRLYSMWGCPLLSLWSIILLAAVKPIITQQNFKRFTVAVYSLFALILTVYSVGMLHAKNPSRINFPGRMLANTVTYEWRDQFQTPLKYVAGPRWLAGNVAFYSKDRPLPYFEWNQSASNWLDEQDLKRRGAIFIWDKTQTASLPKEIQHRFPKAKQLPQHSFQWKHGKQQPKLNIGLAVLPPHAA